MSSSRTSRRQGWITRHTSDPYVRAARATGYRSRAAYKLLELNRRIRLIRPGMTVVDLGAAPGGWSQVVAQLVGLQGRVMAVDRQLVEPLSNVQVVQGNLSEADFRKHLLAMLGRGNVDLVISDMAPNISGIAAVDQAASLDLVEDACELARDVLKPGGDLLVKVFMGESLAPFTKSLTPSYRCVLVRKPKASRDASREVYVLARGFQQQGEDCLA
ncbi:MAG: RlmE family RNA methyltransferase [Gammaproteobacteria bacterium]